MMTNESFKEFLKGCLDEELEKKRNGYQKMEVPVSEAFDTGSTYTYDVDVDELPDELDYDDEEDYESEPTPLSTSSFTKSPSNPIQDSVFSNFTNDLFSRLYDKFKPSKETVNTIFSSKQPFEDIPDGQNEIKFCGSPFKYTRYESPLELDEDLEVVSNGDLESTLYNFREVLNKMMIEVERIYGGLDRITDIAIVSDILIINKVSFEPLMKDKLIKSLPVDLQYSVRNGCFAYLFDFSYLPLLKNLVNFKIDNVDFLFSKVRVDLGKGRNFEPKDLFNTCRRLNVLQVGEYIITRQNVSSCDDVFHRVRRSTEIADKLESLGFAGTKASWGCVRDIFLHSESKIIWKGIKLATMIGVASSVSVAAGGFKLARFVGDVGKRAVRGVGNVIDAVKENS